MDRDYLLRQIALQRKYEKDCSLGQPVRRVNLSGSDFSGMDLSVLNFSNMDLKGSNFTNCTLSHVRFENTDLIDTDFSDTSLTYILFKNAKVSCASFERCSLHGVTILASEFDGVNFSDTTLYGCRIEYSDFIGASHQHSQIFHTHFEYSVLTDNVFRYSNLTDIEIEKTDFDYALVENCIFVDVNTYKNLIVPMDNTEFKETKFFNCDFSGADLTTVCFDKCFYDLLNDSNLKGEQKHE